MDRTWPYEKVVNLQLKSLWKCYHNCQDAQWHVRSPPTLLPTRVNDLFISS